MKKCHAIIVSFLMIGHLVLSLSAAFRLSPTWDEINYPISGAMILRTGSLSYYPLNTFLARLAYGVPAMALAPKGPASIADYAPLEPPVAGFQFFFVDSPQPIRIIAATRFPAVLFSLAAALMILWIGFDLWGSSGAIVSLISYFSVPLFMSRSSLALLEMPMFAFMLAAFIFYSRWLKHKRLSSLGWAGAMTALSCLSKLTALPMMAVIPISLLFLSGQKGRLKGAAIYAATAAGLFLAGFLVWGGGVDAMIQGFQSTLFFNTQIPFYWKGRYLDEAPSLLSWAAWSVKAPPILIVLALGGLWEIRKQKIIEKLFPWILLTLIYFGLPLIFTRPVSTIQLSPIYFGFVVMAGALGLTWERSRWRIRVFLAVLLTLGLVDAIHVHPNYLGYFNIFSGGVQRGSYWLSDSDQDWGQSLPALGAELSRRPPGLVVLSYSGAGDPGAYGISYLDLISAALVSRFHKNPDVHQMEPGRPIYVVIASKMNQIAPEFFEWLNTNRVPIAEVEGNFRIFEISSDPEALGWLGSSYELLHRSREAAWFKRETARIALLQTGRR